ncbi:methyltransferase [Kitasatospora sp. NPDC093679]|uniref:methyltransferase n=1 Tax=Kitasatospora sp. NPDC093679 TaxID=3154983 RepID=UPI00343C9818
MPKLTKDQAKLHRKAAALVDQERPLTEEEKEFVLDHWQESASAGSGALDGAYFTPAELARDLAIEVSGDRIVDLCAGIGRLAFSCRDLLRGWNGQGPRELVCVERNPEYVRVGRKVLPEAIWIVGDVLDLPGDIGQFDTAIGNPPFGSIKRSRNAPGYQGRRFEYHVIAAASRIAQWGVFIVPQLSAPFRYSGRPHFTEERDSECLRFEQATGIRMGPNCGIDTAIYQDEWRWASPATEIVVCDFTELSAAPSQPSPPRPAAATAAATGGDAELCLF